ncbi:hypothetical protein RhiJN_10446 [Ceratobasidium sp. AG-Ba]|nr:hypothetical protein RhiJN_10446 [Ceratobasidium sp. AG-Ba]QRW11174.1 hypothetical protein RhiLY_10173 [Ceratobasidium sp. AG-Ba]
MFSAERMASSDKSIQQRRSKRSAPRDTALDLDDEAHEDTVLKVHLERSRKKRNATTKLVPYRAGSTFLSLNHPPDAHLTALLVPYRFSATTHRATSKPSIFAV